MRPLSQEGSRRLWWPWPRTSQIAAGSVMDRVAQLLCSEIHHCVCRGHTPPGCSPPVADAEGILRGPFPGDWRIPGWGTLAPQLPGGLAERRGLASSAASISLSFLLSAFLWDQTCIGVAAPYPLPSFSVSHRHFP